MITKATSLSIVLFCFGAPLFVAIVVAAAVVVAVSVRLELVVCTVALERHAACLCTPSSVSWLVCKGACVNFLHCLCSQFPWIRRHRHRPLACYHQAAQA